MSELAAPEPHDQLELVAVLQQARRRLDLRIEVMLVDLRRDPDFLPGDRPLLLLGFTLALLRLVSKLPKVTDLADRRDGRRGDLDEVIALALSERERTRRGNDAQLLPVGSDEPDGGNADLVVDPKLGYEGTPFRRRFRRTSRMWLDAAVPSGSGGGESTGRSLAVRMPAA